MIIKIALIMINIKTIIRIIKISTKTTNKTAMKTTTKTTNKTAMETTIKTINKTAMKTTMKTTMNTTTKITTNRITKIITYKTNIDKIEYLNFILIFLLILLAVIYKKNLNSI
jgi:hypothetical protein